MLPSLKMTQVPKTTTHPGIQLQGLQIRTRNQDEMAPGTGKIPGLWESFYRDIFPSVTPGASVYGVYTNYESDHTGHYDLSAAVAQGQLTASFEECVALKIQSGTYLQFLPEVPGDDPVKQVMAMWQRVWTYFSEEGCQHQRAYTTDFELYHSDKKVELYIAVK